ncbi:putative rhamnosyl transferase [Sulfitobacter sp. JB4-11]|uniref:putative rhamnosyl transferase n=1 Tax=Sulfitobacter rhodophyticola TaxID=3238304 RepID=UPI003D81AED4
MQAIGLCRFSYPALGGFQVEHDTIEDRIAYLYEDARLEERFRLLETVALPCLRAQTDKDFILIIVIGDQFPAHYKKRLEALIDDLPQALIHEEPPRKQREVMKEILNDARKDSSEPCLQFRYDDDDAVAVDFIAKLRQAAADCAPLLRRHRSVAFDWNRGFVAEFGADGIAVADLFRQFYVASLGMFIKGNSPLTIMNFAHEKIPRFMPAISFSDDAMFVRSHNGFNDSRQKQVRQIPVTPISAELEETFRQRFAIDVDHVRRVFSAP